ncbi:hypothetical protein JCGZ_03018 [Jatropha curcas]|uniref:Uncharacterized protein n=1 Tax=Jatropha curcas TaxID=180498 RepID=A0A067L111_JATCU|nr:hypothetical protein JCGZ_03018 [Jatropha curcas]
MAKSSSTSFSSDSLIEKEQQLLKKLTEKYEKQESGLKKKSVVESSSGEGKLKSKIVKSKGKEKDLRKEKLEEAEKEKEEDIKKETEAESEKEPRKERKDFVDPANEEEVEVEDASDAETEKLEISDEEENEPEIEAKKTSEFLSAYKSREAMLNRMEKDLIEEHIRELDEAIKHGKAMVANTQSHIESIERMKNVNERRLATLKVKATPYTPNSEKPKRVKHTARRHRVHHRKPPPYPSFKRYESPAETSPAQNLRSSKRLRTYSKPL